MEGSMNKKETYETTTSFAYAENNSPASFRPNSTPIALGCVGVGVSNKTLVTVACIATVKFLLASTSGVKYADSADTRLNFLST